VSDLQLIPIFLIGVLGGVHCIGMCGGIVGAFSVAEPRRPFPVAVRSATATLAPVAMLDDVLRVAAYNSGRIASYALAGAVAGGVAQGARSLSFIASFQVSGYVLANLMLVALGLYLMDAWRGLARLEAVGQFVWRRVQPLIRHLLPVDSVGKAFGLGALWGWVPCAMVYSVLLTAMLSGSATSGALVMFVFGLGTLPLLLGLGLVGARLQIWTRKHAVRVASGALVIAFGLFGLARASHGLTLGWIDAICVSSLPWPGV
jgi:uncharacterized protein